MTDSTRVVSENVLSTGPSTTVSAYYTFLEAIAKAALADNKQDIGGIMEIKTPMITATSNNIDAKLDPVMFHVKGRFKDSTGKPTHFELLKKEITFTYYARFKREVAQFSRADITSYKSHIPTLHKIVTMIEQEYGVTARSVFVNHYRNGDDSASYHKDSYGGTGVFTVSFGGTRIFLTKTDKDGTVKQYVLENGDLYFFNVTFNDQNRHSIPVRKRMNDPRISVVLFT